MRYLRQLYRKWRTNDDCNHNRRTPLPKMIITTLFMLFLCHSMMWVMAFSYLPKMVMWFGTSETSTGYYAGMIGSSLFVGRTIFCFIWGYIADVKGNKFTTIICTVCSATTTLAFGFSYYFEWALVTRFLQGCAMGLVVISKSILSAHCDDTNITLGMSILFCAFSVGMLIGPSIAGFLVFPAKQYPHLFAEDGFFGKYAVLLPNLVIFIGFGISLILAIIFLPNDKRILTEEKSPLDFQLPKENQYVTSNFHKFESLLTKIKNSKMTQVIRNKSCLLISILYGTYSLAVIGMEEMFPLYASTSRLYKGLGLSPAQIGIVYLIVSAFLMILQITLLTKLTVKYGNKKMFIWSTLLYGITAPILPTIAGIQNPNWFWIVLSIYLTITRTIIDEGFLTVNMMVNNSVDSSLLGSANGFSMSLSSIGRGIGPVLFGSIYAWSLTNIKGIKENKEALGFPFNQYLTFFVMSATCVLNGIIGLCIPDSLNHKYDKTDKHK